MANDIKFTVSVEGKDAEKALQNFNKSLGKTADKSVKNFSKMDAAFGSFIGNLAANATGKVFSGITSGAKKLFDVFIKDGVQAAIAQEQAIASLNAALERNGNFTKETSQDLQNFASELQQITGVGDEVTLELLSLAQAFGFTAEESKVATQAAIELSEAAGISVDEALRRVGRTISGSIEDVSKFAPEIKNLTKEQLAAGGAAQVLADALGGTAAAKLQTFGGQLSLVQGNFGDLTEVVGGFITENDAVLAAFTEINKALFGFQGALSGNKKEGNDFVTQVLFGIIKASEITLRGLDVLVRGFRVLSNAVTLAGAAILNGFIAPLRLVAESALALGDTLGVDLPAGFKEGAQDIIKISDELNNQITTDAQDIGDAFTQTGDLDKAADRVADFSDNIKISLAEAAAADDSYTAKTTANSQKRQEAANNEIQLTKQALANIAAAKAEADILEQERQFEKGEFETEAQEEKFLKLEEDLGTENAIKVLAEEESILALQDAASRKEKFALLEQKKRKLRIENDRKVDKLSKEQALKDEQAFFASATSLANSENKTLAAIGKSAALIQIAQDTERSASSSYRFGSGIGGPILGATFAGIAIAAGTARAAKVAGISGFQDGGIVGGPVSSTDNQTINVAGGELILNRRQQENLFGAINNNQIGAGGDQISVNIAAGVGGISDDQVDTLITALNDRQEFGNNPLAATREV